MQLSSGIWSPRSPVAVIKKFTDDNGGVLVSNLAYAAFVSVFPLLLILVTVLVNIAAQRPVPAAQRDRRGDQAVPADRQPARHNVHALRRSTTAGLIVGLLLLFWGVTRLAQAGLYRHGAGLELARSRPGPATYRGSAAAWSSSAFSRSA